MYLYSRCKLNGVCNYIHMMQLYTYICTVFYNSCTRPIQIFFKNLEALATYQPPLTHLPVNTTVQLRF